MTTPSLTAEEQLASCLANQQNLKRSRLFNIPPFRYTPISPYNGSITQYDLDMRRKAEILKYNKNSNGKFTKKQSWAQTVAGSLQRRTYSQTAIQYISSGGQCEDVSTLPMPTSSSGVPGPVINLYYDPAIPLYNYSTTPQAYGTENYEDNDMWLVKSDSNINSLTPTVFTLNIRKPIDKTVYSYSFSVPIALYISGYNINQISGSDVSGNFTVAISVDSVSVKYGGQPIIITQPTISYANLIQNVAGKTNSYINEGTFNGILYIGTIAVSNLVLLTNPETTYDILFNYKVEFLTQTNIYNIKASLYTNFSGIPDIQVNNMAFTTTPSTVSKPPLVLTGI
jgi:hypothetical protein